MPTVQAKLSLINHAMTATITADTAAAGWPASNLRYPQSPRTAWRSTTTATTQIYVDFATPKLVELVVLVMPNFLNVALAVASTIGGSDYLTAVTPTGWNRWSRHRQLAFVVSPGQTYRYLRLGIPADATLAYFELGGIWAGQFYAMPRDIRWEEEMVTMEPHLDLQPQSEAWRQRLTMGDPYTIMRARRLAVTATGAAFGVNAELEAWNEIDYYMWTFDAFAWYANRGNTAEAWIMRRISEAMWPIHQTVSEGDLILEEVMGP